MYAPESGDILAEMSALLFAALSRSDQRRNGMHYLRGLLEVEGRKSIRNIATVTGAQANEQSLHHFINSSTWDWTTVRRALSEYLLRAAPPQAWVVCPMIIPITGHHTVGVERHFIPALGQTLNVQQAIGVWSASDQLTCPISWRLHLSQAWLRDISRRNKASIPDHVPAESITDCMTEAILDVARKWNLPGRPVVFESCDAEAVKIIRRVEAAQVPMLVRISGNLPLSVAEPSLVGLIAQPLTASQILAGSRDMRRLVAWTDDNSETVKRTSVVSAVRVRIPARYPRPRHSERGDGRGEMVLIGAGAPGSRWPTEYWLTDIPDAPLSALFQLSRLLDRVERDTTEIGDQVGIRDFRGRSFDGWHRHMTLSSSAHAIAALSRRAERASCVS
jgi:SRSO17 transposase